MLLASYREASQVSILSCVNGPTAITHRAFLSRNTIIYKKNLASSLSKQNSLIFNEVHFALSPSVPNNF